MTFPGSSPVRLAATLAIVAMLTLTSCVSKVTSLTDPKGQDNFVNACQAETRVEDGAQVTIPMAPEEYCKCVLDKLLNNFTMSDDDFKAYEDRIAKGDDFTPPEQVSKSMQACAPVGPAAPSSTSTAPAG